MVVNGCPLTHTPHAEATQNEALGATHTDTSHSYALAGACNLRAPELTSQSQSEALRHGNGNYVFATALSHNRSDVLD